MKLPEGYVVEAVLSPGPVTWVALAREPRGESCIVKVAAVARGAKAVENETAALRALAAAGITGVPAVRDAWEGGMAIDKLEMPTLRAAEPSLRKSPARRDATAREAFAKLAAVHEARDERGHPLEMLHGDLSPDNVYVAQAGADGGGAVASAALVALADFGLASWRGSPQIVGGAFRGTLSYAAPEAARGERLDGRSDDFALAASLLHAVTGIALREGGTGRAAVTLVEAGTRPLDAAHPWRTLAYRLFNPAVADALLACLAFDPRDRPRETPRPW